MKFLSKYGPYLLCCLIVFQAFYKPPTEYVIRLTPYGLNQALSAINASNGIPGEERVQLIRVIQEQVIQQDKDWAHMDSLRNVKPKK